MSCMSFNFTKVTQNLSFNEFFRIQNFMCVYVFSFFACHNLKERKKKHDRVYASCGKMLANKPSSERNFSRFWRAVS